MSKIEAQEAQDGADKDRKHKKIRRRPQRVAKHSHCRKRDERQAPGKPINAIRHVQRVDETEHADDREGNRKIA